MLCCHDFKMGKILNFVPHNLIKKQTINAMSARILNPIVPGGGGGGKFTPLSRFFFNTFRNTYVIELKFFDNQYYLFHTCEQNFRPIQCLLFKLCSIIEQVLDENSGKKHCIMGIKEKHYNFR